MSDTRTARKAAIRARYEQFKVFPRASLASELVAGDIPWLLDELDAARRTALLEAAEYIKQFAEGRHYVSAAMAEAELADAREREKRLREEIKRMEGAFRTLYTELRRLVAIAQEPLSTVAAFLRRDAERAALAKENTPHA